MDGENTIRTIDEYLATVSEKQRVLLQQIREAIHAAAPEAQERISYSMPAFWQGKVLIYFAAMKEHIGIYPTSSAMKAFADRLAAYNPSKGVFRIPYDQPIPFELIAEITRFRLAEVAEKQKRT